MSNKYTKVGSYTDKQLLDRVMSLPSFSGFPTGYWILGVRSNEDTPDVLDDKFYLFKGKTFLKVTTGTTNPGKPALVNGWKKVNKDGAFVIKSDYWHYNLWQYGLHQGKIPALLQTGAQVVGYRDNNNNDKAEETGNIVKGWFGINFHFNSYTIAKGKIWQNIKHITSWIIGGWSYGCQVLNNYEDYKYFIDLCGTQSKTTYCLINEF